MNPKKLIVKTKNFIAPHVPDILLGTALVLATASITALVLDKDDPENDHSRLTREQFKHMNETGDALLLRTYDYGDFILYQTDK